MIQHIKLDKSKGAGSSQGSVLGPGESKHIKKREKNIARHTKISTVDSPSKKN